jgi:general secretion pathway protein B
VAESFITEPKVQVEIESKVEFEPNVETEVDVVDIEQGSQAQLSKVPSISVTSHIYSSQADRRSIVVNDQRLVEGDFVANQVQVNEITPQGMILEVDGLLFAVSRSRGWNR